MNRPKRVAAIHDLSVFGRCSLSVITPIISALGTQVLPVPTVLMSTHTGGFKDIEFSNCGDFVHRTADHLKKCNAEIDCIYSGYIADKTAFDGVYEFIKNFPKAMRVIDPVLGDNGKIYSALSPEITNYMRELIKHADIITPNLTEVALLLNIPYKSELEISEAKDLLDRLGMITDGSIVITGALTKEYGKCNLIKENNKYYCVPCILKNCTYEGTGDAFASVLTGCVLNGISLCNAVAISSEFIENCLEITNNSGEPRRDGIFIEPMLKSLTHIQNSNRKIIYL